MSENCENHFGHAYNKYTSGNFVAKRIMKGYLDSVEKLLSPLELKNLLDIGCGEGDLTGIMKSFKSDAEIEAIDLNEGVLENSVPGVTFKKMSVYELEYPDSSFDLVSALETLEHLDLVPEALAEIKRVAKEYVLLSVPREPMWRLMNIARFKYWNYFGAPPGHQNFWSTKGFVNLINGFFDVIEVLKPIPFTILLCKKKS